MNITERQKMNEKPQAGGSMTAAELIAALQEVPAETMVYMWTVHGGRAPVISVDDFAVDAHGCVDLNVGPE